jgi:hypothetical protein
LLEARFFQTNLLFFAAHCPAFVRDAPRIVDLLGRKAYYSGKTVIVTGRVSRLDQWASPAYGDEEFFWLCDQGCIRVYMRARSAIHNGDLVSVSGEYYAAFRQYRHTYYNELEGGELLPRE